MKRIFVLIPVLVFLCGCTHNMKKEVHTQKDRKKTQETIVDASGTTLISRFHVPDGFKREKVSKQSLAGFLRTYPLKPDRSKVYLYNGKLKNKQTVHAAVMQLPLEHYNLQQCADSVMRVYAEYFWQHQQYDKIKFHFVDGFYAKYSKWRKGYRIAVSERGSYWTYSGDKDTSYAGFQKYLKMVFAYSGTISLEKESDSIQEEDIRAGDIWIKGGSPGHVVMVVDVCIGPGGQKAFLLAQGYMPAQEFHVLKNPAHTNNPWYFTREIRYPFRTPQYQFKRGSLKRPEYDRR